jgi:hypothetical protein
MPSRRFVTCLTALNKLLKASKRQLWNERHVVDKTLLETVACRENCHGAREKNRKQEPAASPNPPSRQAASVLMRPNGSW